MFGTILKKTFWNTFDHLGGLVLLNLAWMLLATPWLIGGFLAARALAAAYGPAGVITGFAATLASVWLSPGCLWVLSVCAAWARYEPPDRSAVWSMLRERLLPGLWLSLAVGAVALILGVNGAFYLRLGAPFRWLGLLLAGVMIWGLVALLAIAFHTGLQLARDRNRSVWHEVRRASLYALALPLPTIATSLCALLYASALAFTQIGVPLIAMSFPAMFAATAEREILRRLQPPSKRDDEASRREEVRTFRDLIRPWDMDR